MEVYYLMLASQAIRREALKRQKDPRFYALSAITAWLLLEAAILTTFFVLWAAGPLSRTLCAALPIWFVAPYDLIFWGLIAWLVAFIIGAGGAGAVFLYVRHHAVDGVASAPSATNSTASVTAGGAAVAAESKEETKAEAQGAESEPPAQVIRSFFGKIRNPVMQQSADQQEVRAKAVHKNDDTCQPPVDQGVGGRNPDVKGKGEGDPHPEQGGQAAAEQSPAETPQTPGTQTVSGREEDRHIEE